jgi:hypothetical protein
VTRLTVVPLRSSPIQGNDKNLGPLSTPSLGNLTRLSGNKRYRHQPEFPLWNPEWLTVYPELPVWNFYPIESKNFTGECLLKTAQFGGNSGTPSEQESALADMFVAYLLGRNIR